LLDVSIFLQLSNVLDTIMLQRNLPILATIGVSLIFAILVQIPHSAFAQGPPFELSARKSNYGYSDGLKKSKSNFQDLTDHGCDALILSVDTIQFQKRFSEYAKTHCRSAAHASSSLNSSSLTRGLIPAPPSGVTGNKTIITDQQPVIADPDLKVETVFKGDKFPSSMALLGPNDILLLQKNNGTVERVINGTLYDKPLLHANVATQAERGMLGIAATNMKNSTNNTQPVTTYVFLYLTEVNGMGIKPKCNCIYRYQLLNNSLVNPKLLLSLPATPGPYHNGGRMLVGPDNNVYLAIGDLYDHRTKSQNFQNGTDPDGTGGILRITQDGKPVGKGIIGDKYPLNLYYGYGIRNSFGIDFDPVTGKLWDTENGPGFGDEINLVEPGFNSGWTQVQGIWKPIGGFPPQREGPLVTNPERRLVDFGGKGKYRDPELSWAQPVGPTALKFLNSTKLGKQYQNDMFVGDFNNGNLYHFNLNNQRNGLILNDSISNKIVYGRQAIELPADWIDPFANCKMVFECTVNSTNGWQNRKTSFQVSTSSTNNDTWSYVGGKEIDVKPNVKYGIVTHMKLNEFAIQSHVAIEGYDETSMKWDQISQCPTGINGYLEWYEFSCVLTVPKGITKIRPILNAGWSSQPGKEAMTLFDAIHIEQIAASTSNNNLVSNPNFAQNRTLGHGNIVFGYGFGPITDIQIGPDGYPYILSVQKDLGYPYASPAKEAIYRIVPARQR
jgi:aldose sugar dehydrogenase